MKKIIGNKELREIMKKAIKDICIPVGSTLGPTGSNVLISSDLSPFITNDGVTIASNIESDDIKENAILEIIKEASLKTNELVGDGTTTTLVLLESIFNEGLKKIENGKNAIILKQEMNECLNLVLKKIDELKTNPTENNFLNIASTSSNSFEIGSFLTKIFLEMKSKNAIKLDESKNEETYFNIKKGYILELENISNLYFINQKEIELKDCYILILDGYFENINIITDFINDSEIKNLIIFSNDYSDYVKEELLSLYLNNNKNIFLINLPDYIKRRHLICEDLIAVTNCKVKNVNEMLSFNDLGFSKKIILNEFEICFEISKNMDNYLNKLNSELISATDEFEINFIQKRIASINSGLATIYIGGQTKTEIKEKRMRFEDALNALETSKSGISIGSGITYLKVLKFDSNNDGDEVIKNALIEPFKKIYENCATDYSTYLEIIKNSNFQKVYNLKNQKLEDINTTSVIDPTEVIKVALKNAVSIATMLLTTNYLVINENDLN